MLNSSLSKPVVVTIAACCMMATNALADTCKSQSDAKNLHGAAETSFLTKCQKDAKAKCDSDSNAKVLHGAAAASFKTKCVKDATGGA
jgi:hypothetical protein